MLIAAVDCKRPERRPISASCAEGIENLNLEEIRLQPQSRRSRYRKQARAPRHISFRSEFPSGYLQCE